MMVSDKAARDGLLRFLEARCDVSSQHKLPSEDEILATVTVEYIGVDRAKRLLAELEYDGLVFRYGPYLSDHEIDVL